MEQVIHDFPDGRYFYPTTFIVKDSKGHDCVCYIVPTSPKVHMAYEVHPVSRRPTAVLLRETPSQARTALEAYLQEKGSCFSKERAILPIS